MGEAEALSKSVHLMMSGVGQDPAFTPSPPWRH